MAGLGRPIAGGDGGMSQSPRFRNKVATHVSDWGDRNFAWTIRVGSPDDHTSSRFRVTCTHFLVVPRVSSCKTAVHGAHVMAAGQV